MKNTNVDTRAIALVLQGAGIAVWIYVGYWTYVLATAAEVSVK